MWHFTFAFCGNSLWFFALRPPFDRIPFREFGAIPFGSLTDVNTKKKADAKHQPYEYKLFCFLRKKHNNFNPSLLKILNSTKQNSQKFFAKFSKSSKFFNFWSSERHQSLLGNGRVVTKVNTVNFNFIISKKYGQSSLFTLHFSLHDFRSPDKPCHFINQHIHILAVSIVYVS